MSEEEGTNDRHDRSRAVVEACRPGEDGGRVGPHCAARRRTKTTLENPTTDTCSGSATNRRWDGYLYNIDLFPYVEHRLLAFIEG